jgi:hypothetical protein
MDKFDTDAFSKALTKSLFFTILSIIVIYFLIPDNEIKRMKMVEEGTFYLWGATIYGLSCYVLYYWEKDSNTTRQQKQEIAEKEQKRLAEKEQERLKYEAYLREVAQEQERLKQKQYEENLRQAQEQERLRKEQEQRDRENQAEAARLLVLQRNRDAWEEKVYREEMELRIRNNAMFDFYKKQLDLIAEHKRQGMDIDKEIMDMYMNMKASENEENKDMFEGLFDLMNGMK